MNLNEPVWLTNSSPSIGAPVLGEAIAFINSSRFIANAGGTGDFVVAAAVAGYKTPEQAFAIDGKIYHYYAQFNDGYWEEGKGAYTYSSDTLARTTILANSLGTKAKIDFPSRPIVDVFTSPEPSLESNEFPSGTSMVFFQAAAPLGWTKLVADNDKALRVVSGTGGGVGGSVPFSTVFARTSVDSHTDTISEMPAHDHPELYPSVVFNGAGPLGAGADYTVSALGTNTGSRGGGSGHVHGMDIRVQYMDVIVCSKDA